MYKCTTVDSTDFRYAAQLQQKIEVCMRAFPLLAALVLPMLLSGCNTIASKTNMLSDDKIKSQAGGAIGYEPSEVEIVSKWVEGTNTYVQIEPMTKSNLAA